MAPQSVARYTADFTRILSRITAGHEFTIDDLRDDIEAAQIPASSLGGLFERACYSGVLHADGRTIRSTHPPARGRRILLYRKQATRQDAA